MVAPLGGLVWVERRARRLRASLRVPEPPLRARLPDAIALCALVALVATASAQPVLATQQTQRVRVDAEAYFVFDVSRSMLAAAGRGEPTRLERAKRLGLELRRRLNDVPAGIASLTDRVLPHLYPTSDRATFAATLARAVDVEHPPPAGYDIRATTLGALATVTTTGFFSKRATRRLLVVFTDGETRRVFPPRFAAAFERAPGVRVLFVQLWSADERIYSTGAPDPGYLPDPTSTSTLSALARAAGGRVFSEDNAAGAAGAARSYLGGRSASTDVTVHGRRPLAPYVLALAFAPLAFLLRRRNGPVGRLVPS